MARQRPKSAIPTPFLIGAGAMMAITMVFAVVAKRMPAGPETPAWAASATPAVESRDLHFEDQADGSVLVIDADGDRKIAKLEPGTHGFTRVVLRGMAKERLGSGGSRETAFRLQRSADGSLTLSDPATGRQIYLAAFGEASVAAFEALMTAGVSEQ